ncbi:MAG: glycosyltransferase family 4 protein [Clostridiales bacterium]|nr:glycosyltransferase family 4 protein [Clostridiales bacterium]
MNILIINHYAGSPEMGMEFRPYYFAREWIKSGHKVDIIAGDYSHLRRINPEVRRDFQEELIDDIHYHWIRTGPYEGNGVKRAVTMARFVSKLWLYTDKIIKEIAPDVIICSSTYPIDTYVGQRIRKKSKKRVKLIHEVHDMWPISPMEIGGMSKHNPFIIVMQMAENSFCKNSDVIASLLPAAKEYFTEHGMAPKKFIHIPNGVVLEEWKTPEEIPKEVKDYLEFNRNNGMFNLCFFGSINATYNIDVLIDAIIARNKDDIRVVFIGKGTDKDELIRRTQGHESMFAFFEPISKKSIPSLFDYVDASFVGAKSQKIFRFGISMNKLFDSMMGGKPILYMVDAPNNYIKEYNCGVTVNGNAENDLIDGLNILMEISCEEKKKLGNNGHNAAMNVFNYRSIAKKLLDTM